MNRSGNVLLVVLAGIAIISAVAGGFWWWQRQQSSKNIPLTWEECLKTAGATVLYSYPGQCLTSDGRKVTQPLSEDEKNKLEPSVDPSQITCGTIAGNLPEHRCPSGYTCELDGNYPDAAGKCVPNQNPKPSVCALNQEYTNSATNPLACQCPEGYKMEVVSMSWGGCPEPGMSDCPMSTQKCVKN